MVPKPGVQGVNLTVQERTPENTPLNTVAGTGVGVARKDFLAELGDTAVRKYLFVGRVIGPDGEVFKDWVTFRGKHLIIVRGSKEAGYRICDVCGQPAYFAMGKKYLYPVPPAGVSIFDKFNGGLVVSPEIMERVTLNRWRKLKCVKLPVVSVPKDSLPALTV